jgi:hypothetical protein
MGQKDGQKSWGRILRWVDGFAFGAMLLVMGGVFWGALASGNPAAYFFVRVAVWGMMFTGVVFGVMLAISKFGTRGWAVLMPLGLISFVWVAGEAGQELLHHWGKLLASGGGQFLKISLLGFGGVAGLGLLARLIDRVGVWGMMGTLAMAAGVAYWVLG